MTINDLLVHFDARTAARIWASLDHLSRGRAQWDLFDPLDRAALRASAVDGEHETIGRPEEE